MRFGRAKLATRLCLLVTCLLVVGMLPTGAAAAVAPHYRVGNALSGYAALAAHPGSSPPGVNVWTCRPEARHPRPVVVLPGTLYTMADSFQALGPILANAGYCVFGLDYGASRLTTLSSGRVAAAGDIPSSAHQLASFVDTVLAATGASQVDIVGWSQGGMMPRYYLRFLDGAAKVHSLIGLASSSHGTTLNGLFTLIALTAPRVGLAAFALIDCPACTQQEATAPFIATLNAGGDTVPGVHYAVIETNHDEVVTPYRSAFLVGSDVDNIRLQDQCPADLVDHIGIPYDSAAIQDVLNELGPRDPSFRPACRLALPLIGTP